MLHSAEGIFVRGPPAGANVLAFDCFLTSCAYQVCARFAGVIEHILSIGDNTGMYKQFADL